ncbi:cyclic nucleotide-binding domain-containing protein [Sedimentitalea sp. HM32M-2]|uniref:cyclic nucleotide-binding domain-containing protein n=1 Tax=Sedimentitalea sp. HM32M-2 TaxID=3351566 RepID=UPI0036430685
MAYYNQTQDMAVRWEVIIERFAPDGMVDETLFDGAPEDIPHLRGDIVLDNVTVRDSDGNAVLEDVTGQVPAGSVVAIAAGSAEDRRAIAELLVREVRPSAGRITMAGHDLAGLHQAVIAARIGYASSRPVLFQGTFGDNVMMPVRTRPLVPGAPDDRMAEAIRAGNSPDPLETEWVTPEIAGLQDAAALRDWWLQLIEGMGSGTALFQRGLDQVFDPMLHPHLAQRLVELRPVVQQAVREAGLRRNVYLFKRDLYNPGLPVAENLLHATPRQPITQELLSRQTGFMEQLRTLKLDRDLITLSQEVIDVLRRIFGLDGTDHPLFRKLGLDPAVYETAVELVERTRKSGVQGLSEEQIWILLRVPFQITAEQIGPAFPEALKARVVELRQSHMADMQRLMSGLFAPLDPQQFAPGLTVLDNALFGKISETAGGRADELRKLIADILVQNGVQRLIVELIYDLPVALGGGQLPTLFAEPLALSRATIKRPDILILDQVLDSYDVATQIAVHKNLRALLPDTTLIYLNDEFERTDVFDVYFELQRGRIVSEDMQMAGDSDSAASADLAKKLRALERIDMFSGLKRKQLRLLAFGARWYQAPKGETVFLKGDAPTDGAYLLLEGEADLVLPQEGGADQLIATVGPGALVGELGLIRNEPRALSMVAVSDLRCLRIGTEEFLSVVENDAATAFKLLQVVAGYVKN